MSKPLTKFIDGFQIWIFKEYFQVFERASCLFGVIKHNEINQKMKTDPFLSEIAMFYCAIHQFYVPADIGVIEAKSLRIFSSMGFFGWIHQYSVG